MLRAENAAKVLPSSKVCKLLDPLHVCSVEDTLQDQLDIQTEIKIQASNSPAS